MTGYAGKSTEEMASAFIISTCQLIPKSASIVSDHMHDRNRFSEAVPTSFFIYCGSTAEFFIYPLNSCVGDVDVLSCEADVLAINCELPVRLEDLSCLFDTIKCELIESYQEYPSFVRLQSLGEVHYDWNHKAYESTCRPTAQTGDYSKLNMTRCGANAVLCGPAFKRKHRSNTGLGIDEVTSIFCPQWPREAQNWPNRPRKYGWPTKCVIYEVVGNGCHVVNAQHPSCKDDKFQWRFSFSVAEVILIQSWSQTQQIVYHLLRFFAKRELIQKDCPRKDEVLCSYHLKTLMLWTCEQMPQEWWNSSSVIAICSELLKKLLEWLMNERCQNYFIPEANLFHNPSSSTIFEKTKKRIRQFCNSIILSDWFVAIYILPAIRKSLKVEVILPFVYYLLPLLEKRKAFVLASVDLTLVVRMNYAYQCFRPESGYSGGLSHSFRPSYFDTKGLELELLLENEFSFMIFDKLLFILNFAHALSCGEIQFDNSVFVELMTKLTMQHKIIRLQFHNFPRTFTRQGSRFQFLRALDLMQNLTGSNSQSEFQLLALMSKVYLREALKCDDSNINAVAPAALAYIAALHFASAEYQETIRFCSLVAVYQASKANKETLNAGCLLFIDDIARLAGMWFLRIKITEKANCTCTRIYAVMHLSTEVFAHYLTALSVEKIPKRFDFYDDLPESAFHADKFLNALFKRKHRVIMKSGTQFNSARQIIYGRLNYLTEAEAAYTNPLMKREALIKALMEHAFENMISFYNGICKDFAIQCNTADCYRALYLYKFQHYNELLDLCELILHEPDLPSDLKKYSFPNVLVLPPLDSFFDDDVQSLLGFHTLFYYLSPLHDDFRKFRRIENVSLRVFEHCFCTFIGDNISTYCVSRRVIKCRYYLGRHFLARYLKVRCCIDCNRPFLEAVTEFAAQKIYLPLERIIHKFLLQKLGIIKMYA